MSLDQKKKLLQEYRHGPLKVGTYVDATDTAQNDMLSSIVKIDEKLGMATVNFDGWPNKWNVAYRFARLYPFRSRAKGYSGQKKVAIRTSYEFSMDELTYHHERVLQLIESGLEGMSAFETTQYLSGRLFTYIDALISDSYVEAEIIDKVEQLFKAMIRLITVWMHKLPSMTRTLAEMEAVPNLFLVDPKAAIVEAYPELLETLMKFFGNCPRALHFFSFHDVNQTHPEALKKEVASSGEAVIANSYGVVVQDLTDKDFIVKRHTDQGAYTNLVSLGKMKDRNDICFGYMLNWVQYFAELGGFDAILNLLSLGLEDPKSVKAPFTIISQLTKIFNKLKLVLTPAFAEAYSRKIGEVVQRRLVTLSELDVKNCDKVQIDNVIFNLKHMLQLGMTNEERNKIVELTDLQVGLRYLKSQYLEKRIRGLQDIRFMIDRVQKTMHLQQYIQNRKNAETLFKEVLFDNELESNMLPTTGYLTYTLMAEWLQQNKVLEVIFGEGSHIEIVKRANVLLCFLAYTNNGALDRRYIDLTWACQDGKHEEMVRTIYGLIQDVLPYVDQDVFNVYFEKISQEKRYDEKFLHFLRAFTIRALDKQYDESRKAFSAQQADISDDNYMYDFDDKNVKDEALFIENIQQNMTATLDSIAPQYGMPIFWQIVQDEGDQSKEIRELALNNLMMMFKRSFRKTNRLFWLVQALNQLYQSKSIYQSAKIVKAAIQSYTLDQDQRQTTEEEPTLTHMLQEKIQYTDRVVGIVRNYHGLVKQSLKTMEQPVANPSGTDVEMSSTTIQYDQHVFTGKYPHERTLKTLLNQISYLCADKHTNLGIENFQLLWRLFIDEQNFSKDQQMFLTWINRSPTDSKYLQSDKQCPKIFTAQERKFLFEQILCPAACQPGVSLSMAKCYHTYFLMINKAEGALKTNKFMRVTDFAKLKGMESLWRLCLDAQQAKAREYCTELLINLYLRQMQAVEPTLIQEFVDKCMENITKDGVITILSTFLDRYEGIKEIKVDVDLQRRLSVGTMMSVQILVQSFMDPTKAVAKAVQMYHYQTLGFLRKQIAIAFGVQQSEFILMTRQQTVIHPYADDDKYIRDFPGQFQQNIFIKRNPEYEPANHPKFLLSNNEKHFAQIFNMLKTAPLQDLDSIYDLFTKLPVNENLRNDFKNLDKVSGTKSPEQKQAAWSELLDPSSTFRLMYCISIIKDIQEKEQTMENQPMQPSWMQRFTEAGGVQQLLKCLLELNISQIDSMLKLKSLQSLLELTLKCLLGNEALLADLGEQKPVLLQRLLQYVELVCDFSIKNEEARGLSYEALSARISQAKIKKYQMKLHFLNSSKEQKQKKDDDEDIESEDINLKMEMMHQFRNQGAAAKDLFSLITMLFRADTQTGIAVLAKKYASLDNLCSKGLIKTENSILRNCIEKRIKELLFPSGPSDPAIKQTEHRTRVILTQFRLIETTYGYEQRCIDFYNHLATLVSLCSPACLKEIQEEALPLIKKLSSYIMTREIQECSKSDEDYVLQGSLNLLTCLLQKFPQEKQPIGDSLLKYLLHDCLFEIPHGTKGKKNQTAPKCKSLQTRQNALGLVATIARDNLANLGHVLSYLSAFNKEATWRTNKDSDWSIKLYDDEKSKTGRVGIKNLACICYMNSLNQQLFMIPSFRNDILSIQDPNHDKNPDEDNLFLQWQTLFTGLLLSQKQYVNPKAYCHSFKDWDGNPVNVIEQMDVEEYMNQLFDKLENAIKGTPQAKTIQYHFGGTLANEIICKTCPHKYERIEPFLNIGVAVKNQKSIYSGLDEFVAGDMLDADNQYMCEKCEKKVDAHKRACIKTLPRYLITSLKRFDFDFDTMLRVKLNDMLEFPMELDMTKYTQEWLSQQPEQGVNEDAKLKHPSDYYNYELVGIVVHSGTADSGHYYSYIKEQEVFEREQPEKWYEFNDTLVRDFDKSEIPAECFGGVESNGWKQYMRTANAYVCVYKRKLEENPADSDDEAEGNQAGAVLGQKRLNVDAESPLVKKIAQSNQKYWQNRFMFSAEYTEFVCRLVSQWNTNMVIPARALDCNNDAHLLEFHNTVEQLSQPRQQSLQLVNDISLPLDKLYTREEMEATEFAVFKFAATHYVAVMQRADLKIHITSMVKYLKSYMNYNPKFAQWFLHQFVNPEIIKESFFECGIKPMRQILAGLIYCAMLQTFELEKEQLNDYWVDIKAGAQKPRQTILGNFLLLVMWMMPKIKQHNRYHGAFFQILARATTLGLEARKFLCSANAIEDLLNYFYWTCSPYIEEYRNQQRAVFDLNDEPEIGLPTVETNEKKGYFANMRLKQHMQRMQTEEPNHRFLVQAVANLARSITNNKNLPSRYQLDNGAAGALNEHANVVWLPEHEFIEGLFKNAKKPGVTEALCKAYLHHCQGEESLIIKLWKTVNFGLNEYEHTHARPYFQLFYYLMTSELPFIQTVGNADKLYAEFMKIIKKNVGYFQWMEQAVDFVWKLYTRVASARTWFQNNLEEWEFLLWWSQHNKEPPMTYQGIPGQYQQQRQSSDVRLNKKDMSLLNAARYDQRQNQVLYYYRHQCLNKMRSCENVELHEEVDIDQKCVENYKFQAGQQVAVVHCRFSRTIKNATIIQEIDEIVQVQFQAEDASQQVQTAWFQSHQGKIYPQNFFSELYRFKEVARIEAIIQQRAEHELAMRQSEQSKQRSYWQQNQANQEQANNEDSDSDGDSQEDVDDTVPYNERASGAEYAAHTVPGDIDLDMDNDNHSYNNDGQADSTDQNYDDQEEARVADDDDYNV